VENDQRFSVPDFQLLNGNRLNLSNRESEVQLRRDKSRLKEGEDRGRVSHLRRSSLIRLVRDGWRRGLRLIKAKEHYPR